MKKKIIGLVLVLCICVGLFAGCLGTISANNVVKQLFLDINLTEDYSDAGIDTKYFSASEIDFGEGISFSSFAGAYGELPNIVVKKTDSSSTKYGVYSLDQSKMLIACDYTSVSSAGKYFIATKLNDYSETQYALFNHKGEEKLVFSAEVITYSSYVDAKYAEFLTLQVDGTYRTFDVTNDSFLEIDPQSDEVGASISGGFTSLYTMSPELKDYYLKIENNDYVSYDKDHKEVGRYTLYRGSNAYSSVAFIGTNLIVQRVSLVSIQDEYTYYDSANETCALVKIDIFNLKTGKTKTIDSNFIILYLGDEIYDENENPVGLIVSGYKVVDKALMDNSLGYYVIDENGSLSDELTKILPSSGLYKIADGRFFCTSPDGNACIIDSDMSLIADIGAAGYNVSSCSNGYMTIYKDFKYGIIDSNGTFVVAAQYDSIGEVVDGKALARKKNADGVSVYGIITLSSGSFSEISVGSTESITSMAGGRLYRITGTSGSKIFNLEKALVAELTVSIQNSIRVDKGLLLALTDGSVYLIT